MRQESKVETQGSIPVYVIRHLGARSGIAESSDWDVGGVTDDDAVESESTGDGVRGRECSENSAGLCTAFVVGSKTRMACLEA